MVLAGFVGLVAFRWSGSYPSLEKEASSFAHPSKSIVEGDVRTTSVGKRLHADRTSATAAGHKAVPSP